jgi:hypothetical protein
LRLRRKPDETDGEDEDDEDEDGLDDGEDNGDDGENDDREKRRRVGKVDLSGQRCGACSQLNDGDSNFCKMCGTRL